MNEVIARSAIRPEAFVGLPVVDRLPGTGYGKRVGVVEDAHYTREGIEVDMVLEGRYWLSFVIPRSENGLVG